MTSTLSRFIIAGIFSNFLPDIFLPSEVRRSFFTRMLIIDIFVSKGLDKGGVISTIVYPFLCHRWPQIANFNSILNLWVDSGIRKSLKPAMTKFANIYLATRFQCGCYRLDTESPTLLYWFHTMSLICYLYELLSFHY